jgi:hypothetical protein
MSDRYIDQDETIVYGAHASMRIRSHVKGLIKAFDPALKVTAIPDAPPPAPPASPA